MRMHEGLIPRCASSTLESFNATTDFDLQGDCLVRYARAPLFFTCTSCPTGANLKGPGFSASHQHLPTRIGAGGTASGPGPPRALRAEHLDPATEDSQAC
jgi:hypothetical protein